MSKKKEQKRKARRKAFEKERNMLKNQPKVRYRLDVLWPEGWKTMGGFHTMAQVNAYVAQQEEIRARNESDILHGNIFDMATGKVVASVLPYKKQPEGVAAVKDIEPKGYIGNVKDVPEEISSEV